MALLRSFEFPCSRESLAAWKKWQVNVYETIMALWISICRHSNAEQLYPGPWKTCGFQCEHSENIRRDIHLHYIPYSSSSPRAAAAALSPCSSSQPLPPPLACLLASMIMWHFYRIFACRARYALVFKHFSPLFKGTGSNISSHLLIWSTTYSNMF